jgi:hypothetical protein
MKPETIHEPTLKSDMLSATVIWCAVCIYLICAWMCIVRVITHIADGAEGIPPFIQGRVRKIEVYGILFNTNNG